MIRPDSHDIAERSTLGYDQFKLHTVRCRCGWEAWEETELAATLAWMLHGADVMIGVLGHRTSSDEIPSPW